MSMTPNQEEEIIRFIENCFVDNHGKIHTMITPTFSNPRTIDELLKDDCMKKGASIDASSVGFALVNQSDMRLKPDPKAIYELPPITSKQYPEKNHRRILVFANIVGKDSGKPFDSDGRYILQKNVDKYLTSKGLRMTVKVEPEFFLLDKETLQPLDQMKYSTAFPFSIGQAFIMDLSRELIRLKIPVQVLHHECGHGQYEIELNHENVVKQADNVIVFKNLAHCIAEKHGIVVNFMPKPFINQAGSGQHVHIRLYKKDDNSNEEVSLFGNPQKEDELSAEGESFIAGLLKHINAITAVANPTINSYKRMVPNHEAPTSAVWGYKNRTALLRVPLISNWKEAAVEIRSPDNLCNPYLLFSVLIASGVSGVEENLKAPPCRNDNIFNLDLEKEGIKALPSTLIDAIKEFEKDPLMKEVFTEHNCEMFIKAKTTEWEKYIHHCITDWEFQRYSKLM
ncbi:hypothetical protein ABK040_012929 [Willaertia magna]